MHVKEIIAKYGTPVRVRCHHPLNDYLIDSVTALNPSNIIVTGRHIDRRYSRSMTFADYYKEREVVLD